MRVRRAYARSDFDFGNLLGTGALAQVIHVRDKVEGGEFALKILDKKSLKKFDRAKQAMSERNILSQLSCPHIIGLHFAFQDTVWLYMALDYCPHGDLGELMKSEGPAWTVGQVVFVLGELIAALAYLRKRSIVHRDFKPENVMIDAEYHLRLGDFDSAKVLKSVGHANAGCDPHGMPAVDNKVLMPRNSSSASLSAGASVVSDDSGSIVVSGMERQTSDRASVRTRPVKNTFVGTAEYVAPEMLTDELLVDYACDYWALGVVAYQFAYGQMPFTGKTEYALFQHIMTGRYELPGSSELVWTDFLQLEAVSNLVSMISHLLVLAPSKRLGATDIEELTRHSLFSCLVVPVSELHRTISPLKEVVDARRQHPLLDYEFSDKEMEEPDQVCMSPLDPASALKPSFEGSPSSDKTSPLPRLVGQSSTTSPVRESSRELESNESVSDEECSITGSTAPGSGDRQRRAPANGQKRNLKDEQLSLLTRYLSRICATDEQLLLAGPVLGSTSVLDLSLSRKIVVATSLPRLLVLDPATLRLLREIPVGPSPSPMAVLIDSQRFRIRVAQPSGAYKEYPCKDVDGQASLWVELINTAQSTLVKPTRSPKSGSNRVPTPPISDFDKASSAPSKPQRSRSSCGFCSIM